MALLLGTLGVELSHQHALASHPPAADTPRQHAWQPGETHRWMPADALSLRARSSHPCTACGYGRNSLHPVDAVQFRLLPPAIARPPVLVLPHPNSSRSLGFLDRAPPA
ncbi:MAG: hypothetical protein O7F16_04410 [Acidobacteria bacterium]|nr:hypothetical protein [Acidobacteriota bacterium]